MESIKDQEMRVDYRSVVGQVLSLAIQCQYHLWKLRCSEVMKVEKSAKVEKAMANVAKLKGERDGRTERHAYILYVQSSRRGGPSSENRRLGGGSRQAQV